MTAETYEACKFILGNAKSTSGVLDVKLVWNGYTWLADCDEVSLLISDTTAKELITELPKI